MWTLRLQALEGTAEEHAARRVNGPGFILRFIDWIQPQLQRQWYVQAYGKTLGVDRAVPPPGPPDDTLGSAAAFVRPALPKTLPPPAVPSVLPFHTVSVEC